jgi:hypothetical protein
MAEKLKPKTQKYSIEFFHIYTDEKISKRHTNSLEHLKALMESWSFPYELIILIDNYNPIKDILDINKVFSFIENQNVRLSFWAYEKDMINNAEKLLESLSNNKLLKSYRSYIKKNNKYPCSLLTAAWYLTRLGCIESNSIIQPISGNKIFEPSSRLFNILPDDYKIIESKAKILISNSAHAEAVDKIQNFYYSAVDSRPEDLF